MNASGLRTASCTRLNMCTCRVDNVRAGALLLKLRRDSGQPRGGVEGSLRQAQHESKEASEDVPGYAET